LETEYSRRRLFTARTYLYLIATLPVLAVCYYLVFALPAYNRARLALEREKFVAAQQEKQQHLISEELAKVDAAAEKALREEKLSQCKDEVEEKYWEYIKLNGEPIPGKPGTYKATDEVWEVADRRKKADLEECYRRYGR
jgi:hypothetical protein